MEIVRYQPPKDWISYRAAEIFDAMVDAKSAIRALTTIPYQKSWADELQEIQLKREVAGTSRIEGAEFTEQEFEEAVKLRPEELETRSQRQAAAAIRAYRWIAELEDDRRIDSDLILHIHRLLVEGADDDHCPPGQLRTQDQNVTFGAPRHRGVDGGRNCEEVFGDYCNQIATRFQEHDPIIQALAAHYHLAAMHPFLDGNGRTARAVEALFLQREGLRDTLFIAMSNHYYEEKNTYLNVLAETRAAGHDLTPFLLFGLRGIAAQCQRLFEHIRAHVARELYQNMMYKLFNRLKSPRKRVLAERQVEVLKQFLNKGEAIAVATALSETLLLYLNLQNPRKAQLRDLNQLVGLGCLTVVNAGPEVLLEVNLDWPSEISETQFYELAAKLPTATTHPVLT